MADPTSIVIFGGSGDLTRRKLIPALYHLYTKKRLPGRFDIMGFASTEWQDSEFRAEIRRSAAELAEVETDDAEWAEFESHLYYCPGSFTELQDFRRLHERLQQMEGQPANRLYYLATPPRFFAQIAHRLSQVDMLRESNGWRRLVVEKPFGSDLETARALNSELHKVLDERQIFRIDHYLGKETLQNVLVFRFANSIFEPIWNRNYVDHVQITVAESVDVGHRAGYYDQAGVLRDMFQNHMLQMLALTCMEPPASFDADAVRNEKVKLFSAIRPIKGKAIRRQTLRGQYIGYRQADGVSPDSRTATYGILELYVDNWRWHGVPFYLRSGKALVKKSSEIRIRFKAPPHVMFPLPRGFHIAANAISICVQPDEGIHLQFDAKVPDKAAEMRSVDMAFHYEDAFGPCEIPDAYERLILDALQGDAALFTRSDGIERAWELIDPILTEWAGPDAPPLYFYEPGTWGPVEADQFIARDRRAWTLGCGDHE